jgi:hypothetical protein
MGSIASKKPATSDAQPSYSDYKYDLLDPTMANNDKLIHNKTNQPTGYNKQK